MHDGIFFLSFLTTSTMIPELLLYCILLQDQGNKNPIYISCNRLIHFGNFPVQIVVNYYAEIYGKRICRSYDNIANSLWLMLMNNSSYSLRLIEIEICTFHSSKIATKLKKACNIIAYSPVTLVSLS